MQRTVADLIKELQGLPQDAVVVIGKGVGTYIDVPKTNQKVLTTTDMGEGVYEEAVGFDADSFKAVIIA